MRKLVPLVLFAAVGAACGTQHPVGSDWREVTETTTCEAMQTTFCVGGFGFTVRADGTYVIGPGPADEVRSGNVADSERAQIAADVAALDVRNAKQCETTPSVPGTTDVVDVKLTDSTLLHAYALTLATTCYTGGRSEAAQLHTDLNALLRKYYVVPFPPAAI